ncbi:MAG: hypothetical protein U0401_16375 [Anaerolineae bacterium]
MIPLPVPPGQPQSDQPHHHQDPIFLRKHRRAQWRRLKACSSNEAGVGLQTLLNHLAGQRVKIENRQ